MPLFDKRWRDRRETFVVPPVVFDPATYRVDHVRERDAKAFTLQNHYSSSFVAARISFGLYEGTELIGVAAYSTPMSQKVIPAWLECAPSEGVELGRFCLLDRVPFNAESWMLSRCNRMLREFDSRLKAVLSFADPMERTDPRTAEVLKKAHWGTAYRAANARLLGRSTPRWLHVLPNGDILNGRTISKVRHETQGRHYAEALIVRAGGDPRRPHESGRAWLDRILPDMTRIHHPGNLAFRFSLQ